MSIRTIIFDGASDDLVHVNGHVNYPECDEVNVYPQPLHAGSFLLKAGEHGGRMRVHAIYDGCWSFAPGLVDEDDEWPGWPIRFKRDPKVREYTLLMEIDAPGDTTVTWEGD